MYDSVMSHTDPVRTLQRSVARPGRSHPAISPLVSDPTARMRIADMMSYLPDDILVKVDRASMAVSLETRVPLLDHRIVEFAWRMPASFHVRGGITKWPLRMVLSRYLPRQLFDRPKSGFSIPVSAWLRGPLRAWAADMLAPASIAATGLLDPKYVARRWNDHLAGHADNGWTLWNMLMLEAWMREERVAHYAGASTHVAVA
jgi:asparagine synthase (glutamine-hydrolysing)